MKKLNNKGFTLVELLAVIVILAVVILIAVTAVLPRLEKARKNSFKDEAMILVKAAQEAYVVTSSESATGVGTTCFTVATLTNATSGYVELKGGKTYVGKIVLNSSGDVIKVYLDDTKNKFVIKNADYQADSNLTIISSYSALSTTLKTCQANE